MLKDRVLNKCLFVFPFKLSAAVFLAKEYFRINKCINK